MKKQIQFMNRIDEKGRFCGLEAHLMPIARSQIDTHTYSYMQCRELYKQCGQTMAFDKAMTGYLINSLGFVVGARRK